MVWALECGSALFCARLKRMKEAVSESRQLSERNRNVLKALIQEHVRTGRPVGSRTLSKIYSEGVSAATLRNVMGDLEDSGYLMQPHTSAGRVPTQEGYRFYVQSMLEATEVSAREVERIRKDLAEESDLDELMNKTSRLLSFYTDSVGFVLSPRLTVTAVKHIEFLKLSGRRLLVILVSSTGIVQHRFLRLDETFSQAELDQASRYLVENFAGQSLLEIRERMLQLQSQEKALYDRILRSVILLLSAGVFQDEQGPVDESEVFLGGTARVLQKLDGMTLDHLVALLETFERKGKLVRLINECIRDEERSPAIRIGLDDHLPEMVNWSLVSSIYRCDQQPLGSLGILGPSRMEYDRAVGLVRCVANVFGQILSERS